MTAQERRDCVTCVLIAVRSEQTLLNWSQRLPADHRRQVLASLVEMADQRAVRMWQDACEMADEAARGES